MSIFCEAEQWTVVVEATADTPPLQAAAVCSRRDGHDGHHCDKTLRVAWTGNDVTEQVDCPNGYDHGQPPNRAARRGTITHTPPALQRADYRPGHLRRR